jgi:hypothetical protein
VSDFEADSPDQDLLIDVVRSPTTGKWHAQITTQQGVYFLLPDWDTESEALQCKECALEIFRKKFL